PGHQSPSSVDADAPEHRSLARRVVPFVCILGALVATIAVVLAIGAVKLPGTGDARATTQRAAAAGQMAANQQWASATCSTVVGWKNEIQHDLHGLTLSLGAIPRVQDAIAATNRMVGSIDKLGLPPALQSAHGRAQIDQFRSDVRS